MANTRTIEITLSNEQFATVAAAVAAGGYPDANSLVQDALWEWHINHSLSRTDIAHLRDLWTEGIESGPPRRLNVEDLLNRAAARLRAIQKAHEG